VALVTGGSRGLGRAIALRLAADGADVAINHLDQPDEAEAVAAGVREAGRAATVVGADVADPAEIERMVAAVLERLGQIDILVNNAGIFPWRDWHEIPVAEWDRVFAVNARAGFLAARACHPGMRERGWGRIVFLASSTFLTGAAELMHYSASKGAVVGLVRSLARATGDDGITVNAVSTGRTMTEGLRGWIEAGIISEEENLRSRQAQAIKRLAEPRDIVGAVAFLVSDDAAYMTGQVLNVDGGRNMY
jgi:3-oxoacyl-[acyl-carrier protein] reductase